MLALENLLVHPMHIRCLGWPSVSGAALIICLNFNEIGTRRLLELNPEVPLVVIFNLPYQI